MTAYEVMARRVVQDGLIAVAGDLRVKDEDFEAAIEGYTNAIMLGLKELLKPDKIKVYDPEKVAEGLG